MANDAAALCVLLLTQQPLVNLLAALGPLAMGLVLYTVSRYGASATRGELPHRVRGGARRGAPQEVPRIRVRHLVSGEGITSESLERAVSLSHEKYCSVAATLNSEVEYEVVLD
jgi:putative redox protein